MNTQDKIQFIRELCATIQQDVIEAVPRMPDEWDGHELRAFLSDKFRSSVITVGRAGPYGKPYTKRTRAYRAACVERNL